MLWKCCTQYASRFGKCRRGHRTGKVSFHSSAKECSNYRTVALISHTQNSPPGFNRMWTINFKMFKLVLEKAEDPEIKLLISTGSSKKSKRVPEKHLFLLYWLCQRLWLCGSQQTLENSSRDENTRPPDLPPEKSMCRSRSNSWNWTWNKLVLNRERSTSRLYIVTLRI